MDFDFDFFRIIFIFRKVNKDLVNIIESKDFLLFLKYFVIVLLMIGMYV